MSKTIDCVIAVSDIHAGCQLAVCPPTVKLDGGGTYKPSKLQRTLYSWWQEFQEWIPEVTHGRPWALVCAGDAMDGVHHGNTTTISNNHADQAKIAYDLLMPLITKLKPAKVFMIRGTECHSGANGENEERLAKMLGCTPDSNGNYSRQELWLKVGKGLAHFLHHIGTSSSNAGESTALCREYAEACTEAGRWGYPIPDWIVRAHRHRHIEVRVPTVNGRGTAVSLPAWQAKTSFAFKISGARQSLPQMGGVALLARDGEFYTRSFIKNIERTKPEIVEV